MSMWRVVSCVLVAFAVIAATADAAEPVKLDLNDLLGNLGGAQEGGRHTLLLSVRYPVKTLTSQDYLYLLTPVR